MLYTWSGGTLESPGPHHKLKTGPVDKGIKKADDEGLCGEVVHIFPPYDVERAHVVEMTNGKTQK